MCPTNVLCVCVYVILLSKILLIQSDKKCETNAKRYFSFVPAESKKTTIIWEFPMATI